MLCATCKEKNIEKEENIKNSIWGFNPFKYDTIIDMKFGFSDFYKNTENKSDFYKIFNEEGYNYSQWYIYYLSRNLYRCKKLHKQIVWFFQVTSSYSFFRDFIKLGKRDDDKHTTLHHYLKYMNNMGRLQQLILDLLLKNGLSMKDEDRQGLNGYDYLNSKILENKDKKDAELLTRQYKELEKNLDQFISNFMRKCEICQDYIEKYQDIKEKKTMWLNVDNIEIIKNIIHLRQECNDIYRKYENPSCINSVERHQYVIDVYKEILL